MASMLLGRSFKYHRPRGIFTAGADEPNALVELRRGARREPNTKATTVELFDGLEAQSQNRFPSLDFDLLSVNNLLSPFLPAGFYYKTFMWPASCWEKVYEPAIRRAAGLGRASGEPDPDTYEKAHAFCDVLVAGSGPAGLMAALTAARGGRAGHPVRGGFRFRRPAAVGKFHHRRAGRRRLGRARRWRNCAAMPMSRCCRAPALLGVYDGNSYAALERVSAIIWPCRRRISRASGCGRSSPDAR